MMAVSFGCDRERLDENIAKENTVRAYLIEALSDNERFPGVKLNPLKEETDDTNMKLEKILRESVLKEYENVNSSSWYISNGQLSLIVWVTHADGDFVDVTFAP